MKQLILIITAAVFSGLVQAQPSGWEVDAAAFEYSMTLTSVLRLGEVNLNEKDNYLAAFVGDECRGVAKASFVESYDQYMYFLTVFSNTFSGEDLVFKCYRASEGKVLEGFAGTQFEDGENIGTANAPVKISDEEFDDSDDVGINDMPLDEEPFRVFQSFSDDLLTVKGERLKQIKLMNLSGHIILSRTAGDSGVQVSTGSMPPGMYLLFVSTDSGGVFHKKILIR